MGGVGTGVAFAARVAGRLTAQRSVEEIALDGTLTVDEPGLGCGGRGREPVDLPRRERERYELVAEHARGGLGTVLRAYDRELGRTVAIKELLSDGVSVESRFLREAFITARLEHPSIVPVHDAGRWPDGRPFYAMKLVGGRSLKEAIREADGLVERMGLLPNLIAVADAIAYAHSRGIIHRDLKPANVLVGEYGETVVVDWGLAKDLDASVPGAAVDAGPFRAPAPGGLTMVGTVMGTPAFMPPEQAAGEEVDERADVYAIGAMLYDLIAGAAPYAGLTAEQIVEAVRAAPPQPLAEREPAAPVDLVAIVERAMARDPGDRYADAGELAADLRRFQRGQFVRARHYTPAARARRWLSRHRALVTVAGAALAVIVVVAAYSVNRVIRERDEATAQRARAEDALTIAQTERNNLLLTQAESALDRDPTEALDWLRRYREGAFDWQRAGAIAADAMSRGVAKHVLHGHDGRTTELEIGADDQMITASTDGTVRLWDLRTGKGAVVARGVPSSLRLHLSHERRWVASFSDSEELVVRDLRDGAERRASFSGKRVQAIRFSPDGRELLIGTAAGPVYRWRLDEDGIASKVESAGIDVYMAQYSPDGTRYVTASFEGRVWVWDSTTGRAALLRDSGPLVTAVAFSPDGGSLAFLDAEGTVRHHELDTGADRVIANLPGVDTGAARAALLFEEVGNLVWLPGVESLVVDVWDVGIFVVPVRAGRSAEQITGDVVCLAVDPARSRLAYATSDAVIHLFDVASGTRHALHGHRGDIAVLSFTNGGDLVSAGADSAPRVWDASLWSNRPAVVFSGAAVLELSFVGPNRMLSAARDGVLRDTNTTSGEHLELGAHRAMLTGLSVDQRHTRAVTPGLDAEVALWDISRGALVRTVGGQDNVTTAAISADGEWVATVDAAGGVAPWSWTGKRSWWRKAHPGGASLVEFRTDHTFITAGADGAVIEWSIAGESRVLFRHDGNVQALATAPRMGHVASAGRDGRVFVQRADGQGREAMHVDGWVTALAFASDGNMLVAASRDGRLHVCRADVDCAVLSGHRDYVSAIAVSPDGTLIASAAFDGAVRLWRADGSASAVLQATGPAFADVQFAPDGASVVASDWSGEIRAWRLPDEMFVPATENELTAWFGREASSSQPGASQK